MREIVHMDGKRRGLRPLLLVLSLMLCGAALADDRKSPVTPKGGDEKVTEVPKTIIAVIDQARLVKVPDGTDTLVIGNPTIADVTMLRQKSLMILTPKAFGETNFIALDIQGNPLAESTIQVIGGENALVVQRGMSRESYSCAPRCQPTEHLGDDGKYLTDVAAMTQQHNARLSSVTPPMSVSISGVH